MFESNPPYKWQPFRKSGLKLILLSVLITLAVPLSTGSASAITPADESKITVIEKRLFFKAYSEEALQKRLERLEKRFFGEPLTGEAEDQRIAKIVEAAGPQVDVDGTVSKGHLTPDPPAAPKSEKSPQSKAPKSKNPGAEYPQSGGPQDNEVAWEKASMAAIGARDLEIRTLMKDAIKLSKRKEMDGAVDKFNQVIRLDPQNAEAFFSLGVIYESKGQLDQALTAYHQAHDVNPDRLDYKEAITALEQKGAQKQEGSAKQAENNQRAKEAADAFKRKEFMSALEMYKRLETDFPKNAPYKYNIGTIYLMMQNPVQALEYYEMARKLNPKEERYVTAANKLKDNLKADEQKRKEVDSQWDQKEKADRQRESGKQKASNPGAKPGKNQKPPKGGKSGNMVPQQQAKGPSGGGRPPVYQQQQPQQPAGYPAMNTGYQQQQQPQGGFNQQGMPQGMQQGYNPQGQMPQGYNPQQGYATQTQQPGFGNPAQQAGYGNQMQQPGYGNQMPPQQGYGNQMQQPGYGNQMQQPGYGNQMQQPGYGNQMQPQGNQMQPGFGNQMQQPGYPPQQGYSNQQQIGQNQMAYAPGQPNVSGLQQPGYRPAQNAQPPMNNMAPTGTGPDPLANIGILAQASPEGVSVTTIGIGSRASKGKMSKGDIIVAVDGINVSTIAQLKSVLARKQPGESAQVIVKRKGKITQLVI